MFTLTVDRVLYDGFMSSLYMYCKGVSEVSQCRLAWSVLAGDGAARAPVVPKKAARPAAGPKTAIPVPGKNGQPLGSEYVAAAARQRRLQRNMLLGFASSIMITSEGDDRHLVSVYTQSRGRLPQLMTSSNPSSP